MQPSNQIHLRPGVLLSIILAVILLTLGFNYVLLSGNLKFFQGKLIQEEKNDMEIKLILERLEQTLRQIEASDSVDHSGL